MELFLSWQAITFALVVTGAMESFVKITDHFWTNRKDTFAGDVAYMSVNGLLGFMGGVFLPLRPDAVNTYVAALDASEAAWLLHGTWGVAVGSILGFFISNHAKKWAGRLRGALGR